MEPYQEYREQYSAMLAQADIVILEEENAGMEMADFGLGDFAQSGLGIIVYVNTDRYCAKELMMLPQQSCPEHRHPDVDGTPAKMETFRCRWGKVCLYLPGEATAAPACQPPAGSEAYYTVHREIVLLPGQQFTIPPNSKHWFQAGPEGAVVSEFSSVSHDELDIFTDPNIQRVPEEA